MEKSAIEKVLFSQGEYELQPTVNWQDVELLAIDVDGVLTDGGLTFAPLGRATRMSWDWEVSPRGPMRLLSPLVVLLGRRQEQRIWSGLKIQLEESVPTRASRTT